MYYTETKPAQGGLRRAVNGFFSSNRHYITPQQLSQKLRKHKQPLTLIDIRGRNSYEETHIDGAESVPPDGWSMLRNKAFEEDTFIVVICKNGILSQEAVRILRERGMNKAFHLRGGMDAWLENGF